MDRAELSAWLRLLETPGIGLTTARRLLLAAGSAEGVFELPAVALASLCSARQREALAKPPDSLDALTEQTWVWLQADPRHSLLTPADPDYPPRLLESPDPPLLLYLWGDRAALREPALAIVGSRNPTAQGKDNAHAFAASLARGGYCIVSGLALGIDGAAHEGALQVAGRTIAVVGTGMDQVYPKRHTALAARVAQHGLVISEYALGTPVLGPNFPRRNRIIAGLSQGCLVVEAAVQSGSLVTARQALEAGREVFAIPGSIHSPQARGCHALIRQGAKLVESAQDILEELLPLPRAPASDAPPSDEALLPDEDEEAPAPTVLEALGHDPVSFDALLARGRWTAAELNAQLLELELDGLVARLAGQLFQRRTTG
ncbi:DNA-processing protein DprA [Roseateles sp.]|uniref:DNA-processing protein DprA n=1 Tax=Roseateles sp. TaxID=1971397 RepID=UPI003937722B